MHDKHDIEMRVENDSRPFPHLEIAMDGLIPASATAVCSPAAIKRRTRAAIPVDLSTRRPSLTKRIRKSRALAERWERCRGEASLNPLLRGYVATLCGVSTPNGLLPAPDRA